MMVGGGAWQQAPAWQAIDTLPETPRGSHSEARKNLKPQMKSLATKSLKTSSILYVFMCL